MNDRQYQDIDLVEIYDDLNPLAADSDFFLAACAPATHAVLDLGCGTGLLTKALAARGHAVTGVDPAEKMLAVAKRGTPGDVRWLCADARDLALPQRFDRVIASGHVFQVFLAGAERLAFLTAAARHLKPDGMLVFDTRNPAAAAWQSWTPDRSRRRIDHAALGPIEIWHDVTAVEHDRVRFTSNYHFLRQNRVLANASELAFPSLQAVEAELHAAGFEILAVHGNWDGSAFTLAAPEIIVTARLSRTPASRA
ncbi:MAG TPA: methyltransferase domain-containing protein [Dongiaceae bacterium]|nr:methyltransferase domain-containing protein [Dongiaceae bacterium]